MIRGTDEGAGVAIDLAFEACRIDRRDISCIAALWLMLYGSESTSITLDDVVILAGFSTIGIIASDDGSTWYCIMSRQGQPSASMIH
jgi:hypothetical protein